MVGNALIGYIPTFVRECSTQTLDKYDEFLKSNNIKIPLSVIEKLLKEHYSCVDKHTPRYSSHSFKELAKDLLICVAERNGKTVVDNLGNPVKSESFCA